MTTDSDDKRGIGRRVGGAIGGALDLAVGTAVGTVGQVGSLLGGVFRLSERGGKPHSDVQPGAAPGVEFLPDAHIPPPAGAVRMTCIDYDAERVERRTVEDLRSFLSTPRPEWARVRWLKVDGLHPYVVNQLRTFYDFHTLAAEDVMTAPQRPRAEVYEEDLFVVAQLYVRAGESFKSQQLSIFLRDDLVVTFHEEMDDVWDPVFARIDRSGSRLRSSDGSHLCYALLDTLVDHAFPVLEGYAERLERLEDEALENPRPEVLQRVHAIKRELAVLRRILWPTRELITELSRKDQAFIDADVRAYFRDIHDHCVQLIDMLETFRDLASGLAELHLSLTNNRMAEVMHLLTLLSSVFIPMTFIAGVYGMNFEHIPELRWRHGYAVFWLLCLSSAGGMLWYFRRRGWLGRLK